MSLQGMTSLSFGTLAMPAGITGVPVGPRASTTDVAYISVPSASVTM